MNELIAKIEQWAEDRNIIKGSKPIDQAMKLFSEFGELADNVGKCRDCRDDIGDCMVVLIIMCRQLGIPTIDLIQKDDDNYSMKEYVAWAGYWMCSWVSSGMRNSEELGFIFSNLINIAHLHNVTLQECVQIAYNDIKDRKGLMHNGVFIKESDPAYAPVVAAIESNCTIDAGALDNIEADKRMATQKRISVNLEDL